MEDSRCKGDRIVKSEQWHNKKGSRVGWSSSMKLLRIMNFFKKIINEFQKLEHSTALIF